MSRTARAVSLLEERRASYHAAAVEAAKDGWQWDAQNWMRCYDECNARILVLLDRQAILDDLGV